MSSVKRLTVILLVSAVTVSSIAGCGKSSPAAGGYGNVPAALTGATATSSVALHDPKGYTATFTISRSAVVKDTGSPSVHGYSFHDPVSGCPQTVSTSPQTVGIEPFIATVTNTTKGFPISVGVNLEATNPNPSTFNLSVGYVGPGYTTGECDSLTTDQGAAFNVSSLAPGVSENFYGFIAVFGYFTPATPKGQGAALGSASLEIYVNNDVPGGQNFDVSSAAQGKVDTDGKVATALIAPG